jgi:glucans biosynthesis protein C
MADINRRYDIDWIRVIAIGLLLIYHVAIGFQPWGVMIGFIANPKSWQSLWLPMSMLNVWRIPLLFFVSGMGVYFALQNRNWSELMKERGLRILVPFLFGMFVIVPIHVYSWRTYYKMQNSYMADPGHLWFLANIFIYVFVLSPLFIYLKNNKDGAIANGIRRVFSNPLGLLLVVAAFILEAMIIRPVPYEMYAATWHGFTLGFLAFFFGFCFVLAGPGFWNMIVRWRWIFLAVAIVLFVVRIVYLKINVPYYLLVPESDCWIFSVLAFGHKYLNKPGKTLTYLSQAAYPVYILHMIFLYLGSYFIFKMDIPVQIQFLMVLLVTIAGCFGTYELIRRVKGVRSLLGLKW